MKAIFILFDSLNRDLLEPYGCEWTHTPNFDRLARKTATFDTSYVCSMPCMPARRDLHTGRPNFLHRSWSPLEPFDDSIFDRLRAAGVSSHIVTDHQHYWEDGGAGYLQRYDSYRMSRGQEGDKWIGQVADPAPPPNLNNRRGKGLARQDWINRSFFAREGYPQDRTFAMGLDFLERNAGADDWFLQIECFDPHEPFTSEDDFRRRNGIDPDDPLFDFPKYGPVTQDAATVEKARKEYASLLEKCDASLGKVLDFMDARGIWEDTLLVVGTDHGFLLGEHGVWGKSVVPLFEEVARTPCFVWDPRSPGAAGTRRTSLVQPAIDLPPTFLSFFGCEVPAGMTGCDLAETVRADASVRRDAIFGFHGQEVAYTDGRYVYFRAPVSADNQPLYDYTLMPSHMRKRFTPDELRAAEWVPSLPWADGLPVLRIPVRKEVFATGGPGAHWLFDLEAGDPEKGYRVEDPEIEAAILPRLVERLRAADAPPEQFERLGLDDGDKIQTKGEQK